MRSNIKCDIRNPGARLLLCHCFWLKEEKAKKIFCDDTVASKVCSPIVSTEKIEVVASETKEKKLHPEQKTKID